MEFCTKGNCAFIVLVGVGHTRYCTKGGKKVGQTQRIARIMSRENIVKFSLRWPLRLINVARDKLVCYFVFWSIYNASRRYENRQVKIVLLSCAGTLGVNLFGKCRDHVSKNDVIISTKYHCTCFVSFEGLCGWNNTSSGVFRWHRDRAGTPSSNTGPTTDNTKSKHWDVMYYRIESFAMLNIRGVPSHYVIVHHWNVQTTYP